MTALTALRGIGSVAEASLNKLGINCVEDLLFHFPLRYKDKTRIKHIATLNINDEALIEGVLESVRVAYEGRRVLIAVVRDASAATIQFRFFHFSQRQMFFFKPGARLYAYGEVRQARKGGYEMIHPEYRFIKDHEHVPVQYFYTPVYPATADLKQASLYRYIDKALQWLSDSPDFLEELLPEKWTHGISLADAIRLIHRPPTDTNLDALLNGNHVAHLRLVFEELLANIVSLRKLRLQSRVEKAVNLEGDNSLLKRLLSVLPFDLTAAQTRVIQEITDDLSKSEAMMRLVQGDVGSGKTIVAVAAMLKAVAAGYQAAMMVPTEILAEQHYTNLRDILDPLDVRISVLLGNQKASEKRAILRHIRHGVSQIVIGTHALFQEAVRFDKLAVVVVDEQHRFGVHQRLLLKQKGEQEDYQPHQLIMTATPIPRSLAMTLYADLDYSVIDTLPPGRQEITTVAVSDERRNEVVERVHLACRRGSQVYWVCTLIEESKTLRYQAAEKSFEFLKAAMPEIEIGLVHGGMNAQNKEQTMHAFRERRIKLLVATTVIEVGVDVPNATLMVIENAERLGLAQLHQLRGRVGRGEKQSTCVLIYHPPLSENAEARIKVMRRTNDGFEIAKEDMRQRGPGEILGTRQTGQTCFRVADLMRDRELLKKAYTVADRFLEQSPEIVDKLIDRWLGKSIHYADV